jgi:hypothetical protein
MTAGRVLLDTSALVDLEHLDLYRFAEAVPNGRRVFSCPARTRASTAAIDSIAGSSTVM